MFRWLRRFRPTKRTAELQHESLLRFMRALGYHTFQEGRFVGTGFPGCEIISHRTAVRLHNTKVWRSHADCTYSPDFNYAMRAPQDMVHCAIDHKIVVKCKQQLVEKQGDHTILTQSHVVNFRDRGYGKATGLI